LVVVEKGGLAGKKTTKDTVRAKLDEIKKEIETLTVLFSEKTVERDKLTRESDSLKASYKLVRLQYEKAQMADRTQASDIVIAGQAVVPEKSAGRSPKMLLLAIAFAGTLMTGVLLLLKELSEIGQGRPSTGLAKLLAAASGSITSEPSPRKGAAMGSQDDSKKPV